jgi:hypothetical protein
LEGKFIHVHDFNVPCDWFWGIEYKEWDTKEEVMRWMLVIQLGRRNLSSIQKIAVKLVEIKKTLSQNSSKVISNNKDRSPYNEGICRFDN